MHGTHDPTFVPWTLQRMPEDVLDLTAVEIDSGHWPMLEAKERVINEVLTWLGKLKLEPPSPVAARSHIFQECSTVA
jgi:hypothetical protein